MPSYAITYHDAECTCELCVVICVSHDVESRANQKHKIALQSNCTAHCLSDLDDTDAQVQGNIKDECEKSCLPALKGTSVPPVLWILAVSMMPPPL